MKLSYKAQKMVAYVTWQQYLKLVPAVAQLVKNPPAMWDTWVLSLGWEDPLAKGKVYSLQYSVLENSMDCIVHGLTKSRTPLKDFHFHINIGASPVVQMVKNLPAVQETRVQSLGQEEPMQKEITHSTILAWRHGQGYSPWGQKESDTTE